MGFAAALRSARRWVGRVPGVVAVLPSTRAAVPTLEVWVEPGTPPGTVPDEHRGVPWTCGGPRDLGVLGGGGRDAPVTAAGSCG